MVEEETRIIQHIWLYKRILFFYHIIMRTTMHILKMSLQALHIVRENSGIKCTLKMDEVKSLIRTYNFTDNV